MTSSLRRTVLAGLPIAGSLALAGAASAQTEPHAATVTIDTLSGMLTNMGYQTRPSSSGKSFAVTAHGNYDVTVTFQQNAANAEVLAYVFLHKVTADLIPRLDTTGMLIFNDSNYCYFSLAKDGADLDIYIQRSMPPAAISPAFLRTTLENLVKATQDTERLWDTSKWK